MVDYFADNGFGNAVALVQHPSGVYHKGVTYVCYQGPLEDPYVASYNHTTKEWKGPYKAGVSEMGKDPNRKKRIDNHGKPAMLIDDAGYKATYKSYVKNFYSTSFATSTSIAELKAASLNAWVSLPRNSGPKMLFSLR